MRGPRRPKAILTGDAPRDRGAQFSGLVPVWEIRPTSCDDQAVLFVTGELGLWTSGYAYSLTPASPDDGTCHFSRLFGDWYRLREN